MILDKNLNKILILVRSNITLKYQILRWDACGGGLGYAADDDDNTDETSCTHTSLTLDVPKVMIYKWVILFCVQLSKRVRDITVMITGQS